MRSLLFLLLFPTVFVSAQDTAITYSEVIIVDSFSKVELFVKARQWFNDAFKSSKDVLEISDKETGELAGKGIMSTLVQYQYVGHRKYIFETTFDLNIWTKDGKYKYQLKNFNTSFPGPPEFSIGILTSAADCPRKFGAYSQKVSDEMWLSAKEGVDVEAKKIINSLKEAMSKKTTSSDF